MYICFLSQTIIEYQMKTTNFPHFYALTTVLLLFLSIPEITIAQRKNSKVLSDSTYYTSGKDTIYIKPHKYPVFPGGETELLNYVQKQIELTGYYKEQDPIRGRVIVSFIVNEDGKVSNIKVERSIDTYTLDKLAVNTVSKMPAWQPGENNNKKVKVKFILPVDFKFR